MSEKTLELWRTRYLADAYTDQTGASHWGHVVYEVATVVEIEGEDFTDPYTGQVEHGGLRRAMHPETGRVFTSRPVYDFHGSRTWVCNGEGWRQESAYTKGYVNPDGTAFRPVGGAQ